MRRILIAAVVVPTAAMPASADPLLINGNVTCANLIELVDSTNRQSIGIATQFMADVFYDADQVYIHRKRGGIVAPLTEDGFIKLVALGFSHCREHPDMQARAVMLDVYSSVRGLDQSLGLVK